MAGFDLPGDIKTLGDVAAIANARNRLMLGGNRLVLDQFILFIIILFVHLGHDHGERFAALTHANEFFDGWFSLWRWLIFAAWQHLQLATRGVGTLGSPMEAYNTILPVDVLGS